MLSQKTKQKTKQNKKSNKKKAKRHQTDWPRVHISYHSTSHTYNDQIRNVQGQMNLFCFYQAVRFRQVY